jgi:Ser/Thr protein kinase RdoA (MazF antagonist)
VDYEGRVEGVSTAQLRQIVRELHDRTAHSRAPDAGLVDRLGLLPAFAASTHLVYPVVVEGERCCLKVFRSWDRGEPDREWALLNALEPTGVAPRPVWRTPEGVRPAVLTSWVDGVALSGRHDLTVEQIDRITHAHSQVHNIAVPVDVAINGGTSVIDRILGWWSDLGRMATELEPSRALENYLADPPFASTATAQAAAASETACLVRGDTNLANYLHTDSELRMIDFEDGGVGTVAFELADMIEHFANGSVVEATWQALINAADADPALVGAARCVVAEFWLALTIRRNYRGLTMRPAISANEQLNHVLELRT